MDQSGSTARADRVGPRQKRTQMILDELRKRKLSPKRETLKLYDEIRTISKEITQNVGHQFKLCDENAAVYEQHGHYD
jgi:hypothetical protein